MKTIKVVAAIIIDKEKYLQRREATVNSRMVGNFREVRLKKGKQPEKQS